MTSADGSTTNQTGSPVWFGVETSSFCDDQRLCAELAKENYQEVQSRCEVSKLARHAGPRESSKKSSSFASAVYERKLYRVVGLFGGVLAYNRPATLTFPIHSIWRMV